MWKSSLPLTFLTVASLSFLSTSLQGQGDGKKFEMAYQWGAEQYRKEIAQVEKAYEAEIRAAQAKRASGIKMARTRYLQGLKFLNGNPALPQALRVKINEDIKQTAALPEPIAPEVKEPVSAVPRQTGKRTIRVKLDTPDSGWSVRVVQVKEVNNELWVLSELQHSSDVANMVITPAEDAVVVEAPEGMSVRHFVLNKS